MSSAESTLDVSPEEIALATDGSEPSARTGMQTLAAFFKSVMPILGSALALLAVVFISLAMGKFKISLRELALYLWQRCFGGSYLAADRMRLLRSVLEEIRLPRIMAAAIIGAALSASGAAYQAMFVNPLVSPSLLGVLGGASFGAALGIVYLKSWFSVQIATFVGGLSWPRKIGQ